MTAAALICAGALVGWAAIWRGVFWLCDEKREHRPPGPADDPPRGRSSMDLAA